MVDAYVRKSELEDILLLAPRLRKEDLYEVENLGGRTAEQSLLIGLRASEECFTVVVDGKPSAMFGVVPTTNGEGSIWLLGSKDLLKVSRKFLRESKGWLKRLTGNYTAVFNYVSSQNKVHIRWLKWLGFEFTDLIPNVGINRVNAYLFYKRK